MRTRFVHTPALGALDGLAFMDDALRTFGALRSAPFTRSTAWTAGPEFAVEANEDGWTLTADVPGLAPDDLEIEAHDGRLTVRAKRAVEAPEGFRAVRRERSGLSVAQRFELGALDAEAIEARLQNGVLTIQVPKAPEAKPRAISVKVG